MSDILDWEAALVSGQTIRRHESRDLGHSLVGEVVLTGLGSVPSGQLECVNIETDHRAIPLVRLDLQPMRGDGAACFTRVMTHPSGQGSTRVPVLEVRTDPTDPSRFVRVYLLDDRIVISTRDLYW